MKRVTITLDDTDMEFVRNHQIKQMKITEGNYSFSEALRDLLRGKKK